MRSQNQVLDRARRDTQRLTIPQMLAKWGEESTARILQWIADNNGSTEFMVGLYTYQIVIDMEIV
jgi:hypothetical protein